MLINAFVFYEIFKKNQKRDIFDTNRKSGVPGFKYFSLELWREFDLFNATIKLPENGYGSAGLYPFLEIPILSGIEVRYKCTFIYSNNII